MPTANPPPPPPPRSKAQPPTQDRLRAVAAYADVVRRRFAARLPPAIPHVALPMQSDLVQLLPMSRRLLHRAHLHALAEHGWQDAQDDGRPEPRTDDAPAELMAISSVTCTACGGKCCRHGGAQSYINHDSLRQFRADRPAASPDDFVAAYADRLAENTFQGSCVHHGVAGCTLPRTLRSETCNHHYCDGLQHIHALRLAAGADFRCLVVRLWDGELHSCILLSDQGFEVLDSDPYSHMSPAR